MIRLLISLVGLVLSVGSFSQDFKVDYFGGVTYTKSEKDYFFDSHQTEFGVQASKRINKKLLLNSQLSTRPALGDRVSFDWVYLSGAISDSAWVNFGWLDTNMSGYGGGIQNPYARFVLIPPQYTMLNTNRGFFSLVTGAELGYRNTLKPLLGEFSISIKYGTPRFTPPETQTLLDSALKEVPIQERFKFKRKSQLSLSYYLSCWTFSFNIDSTSYDLPKYQYHNKSFIQTTFKVNYADFKNDLFIELYYGDADPFRASNLPDDSDLLLTNSSGIEKFSKGEIGGVSFHYSSLILDRVTLFTGASALYLDLNDKYATRWNKIKPANPIYDYPPSFRFSEDYYVGIRLDYTDNQAITIESHTSRGTFSNHFDYWLDSEARGKDNSSFYTTLSVGWSFMF